MSEPSNWDRLVSSDGASAGYAGNPQLAAPSVQSNTTSVAAGTHTERVRS
jgi:hypothetical protein